MRTRSKLCLTALMAAALFATAVGTASARNLSISNSNIRANFRPLIFFNGSNRLSCNVTIEGSFHYRTIVKSINALLGYITRVDVDEVNCAGTGLLEGATASANRETLPWHVTYLGFRGTLPLFERVLLGLHVDFNLNTGVGVCRYAGTAQGSFVRAVSELEADRTVAIPKSAGSFLCPASGNFEGRTRVTLLGTATAVTVTLI